MSTATATLAAPRAAFREVWLVSIGHSLTHWYPATFYVLLPLIGQDLGLSYSQIGLIMTCQFIAGAVSNVPGGMVVDSLASKGLLLALSLFWVGFPYLLMGMSHHYWMLLLCSMLVGIGNNLWHPAAIPTLARRFPERKGLVLSMHNMGGNVGDALAPLAVGALLGVLSWREIVVLNLAPGVLIALVILAYLGTWSVAAHRAPARTSEHVAGLLALLRDRAVAVLVTSSLFRAMTQSALLAFLPLFLAREMHYSSFAVGLCLFVLQAAGFAAAPIAGHLSDRMGRGRIVMSSMAVTVVVLVLMAVAGATPIFVLFIALLGFFLYAVRPVLQAWLLETTPAHQGGTSIGLLFGAQALGAAISPAVAGVLSDRYGLTAMFWFVTATIVVANLLILLVPKER
ncbi:MAG TPA: MFS transporter [Burkholderiales bacterium]|nr:MFS transporter [Burkholderiales bacterium]